MTAPQPGRIGLTVLALAAATVLSGTCLGAEDGGTPMKPVVERVELVTDQAVVGDGGNNWGGHQTRIVRTRDGLFTAYTTGKSAQPGAPWRAYDGTPRFWKLAMRTDTGWKVLAEGQSGREPVNLMAAPDGRLHIIAWPDGTPRLWSGLPAGGKLEMKDEAIPGPWVKSHWPYAAAGISLKGDLALVQSTTESVPGRFIWGYRPADGGKWLSGATPVKQRHCYTYVLPEAGGRLAFTSTRDVLAKDMGYAPSATGHSLGYVFNRVGLWSSDDVVAKKPMAELQVAESVPSKEFPEVAACGTCVDTYVDTRGRLHALYFFLGPETKGRQFIRHSVVEGGKVTKTVQLAEELGAHFIAGDKAKGRPQFCRMIQDTAGRFYLIGTDAIIPADSDDGTTLGQPVPLDLKGHRVEYSGMALAAPRGGTPPADSVDAVFPTDGGRKVVYVRIRLK